MTQEFSLLNCDVLAQQRIDLFFKTEKLNQWWFQGEDRFVRPKRPSSWSEPRNASKEGAPVPFDRDCYQVSLGMFIFFAMVTIMVMISSIKVVISKKWRLTSWRVGWRRQWRLPLPGCTCPSEGGWGYTDINMKTPKKITANRAIVEIKTYNYRNQRGAVPSDGLVDWRCLSRWWRKLVIVNNTKKNQKNRYCHKNSCLRQYHIYMQLSPGMVPNTGWPIRSSWWEKFKSSSLLVIVVFVIIHRCCRPHWNGN